MGLTICTLLATNASCQRIANTSERQPTFIGVKHSYTVPSKFVSRNKSFFPANIGVDSGAELSLAFPVADLVEGLGDADNSVRMLVFLDKFYINDLDLFSSFQRLLLAAEITTTFRNGNYFFALENAGQVQTEYISNFDPFGKIRMVGSDAFGMSRRFPVRMESDWKLGIYPAVSCKLHMRIDGRALLVSSVGRICTDDYFQNMVDGVQSLFRNWKSN
ncbi:MAG: hypothetical protein WBD34_22670 [Burkholderiaceae bacterium]